MLPNTLSQIPIKGRGVSPKMRHLARTSALNVDEVTNNGNDTATYSATSSVDILDNYSDGVLSVGMVVTIASFSNSANNGDFTIISIDDSADTITVDNSSAVNETGASGTMAVKTMSKYPQYIAPDSEIVDENGQIIANVYDSKSGYFVINKVEGDQQVQVTCLTGTSITVTIFYSNDGVNWDTLPTPVAADVINSGDTEIYHFLGGEVATGAMFRVQVVVTGTETYTLYLQGD